MFKIEIITIILSVNRVFADSMAREHDQAASNKHRLIIGKIIIYDGLKFIPGKKPLKHPLIEWLLNHYIGYIGWEIGGFADGICKEYLA